PEDSVVDAAVVAATLALVEDAHGKFAARSQRASPRGLEFVATVTGAGGQRRQPDRIAHASGHAGRILRAVPGEPCPLCLHGTQRRTPLGLQRDVSGARL